MKAKTTKREPTYYFVNKSGEKSKAKKVSDELVKERYRKPGLGNVTFVMVDGMEKQIMTQKNRLASKKFVDKKGHIFSTDHVKIREDDEGYYVKEDKKIIRVEKYTNIANQKSRKLNFFDNDGVKVDKNLHSQIQYLGKAAFLVERGEIKPLFTRDAQKKTPMRNIIITSFPANTELATKVSKQLLELYFDATQEYVPSGTTVFKIQTGNAISSILFATLEGETLKQVRRASYFKRTDATFMLKPLKSESNTTQTDVTKRKREEYFIDDREPVDKKFKGSAGITLPLSETHIYENVYDQLADSPTCYESTLRFFSKIDGFELVANDNKRSLKP